MFRVSSASTLLVKFYAAAYTNSQAMDGKGCVQQLLVELINYAFPTGMMGHVEPSLRNLNSI